MKARWGKGPDFAEIAEALGVPTDHIMSTVDEEDGYFVLYTPSLERKEPPVYRASLRRGPDNVLVLFGEPSVVEGFYERFRALMEGHFRDNPPESSEGGT